MLVAETKKNTRGAIFITDGSKKAADLIERMSGLFDFKVMMVGDEMLGGAWGAPTLFAPRNPSSCRRILTRPTEIENFLDWWETNYGG